MTTYRSASCGRSGRLAFAVVSFTSQQTVVRGHVIRREVPRSFVTGDELLPLVLLSIPLAVVVFVWNEQIFRSGSYWWPFLAMAMPFGTLLSGTTRGLWAASGRLAGLSFVIAGENVNSRARGCGPGSNRCTRSMVRCRDCRWICNRIFQAVVVQRDAQMAQPTGRARTSCRYRGYELDGACFSSWCACPSGAARR